MSETIEVGDIVKFRIGAFDHEYTVVSVNGDEVLLRGNIATAIDTLAIVHKAAKDPYSGLNLPTPPAGYRLAKWGEGVPVASLWWDYNLKLWTHEWVRTEWPRDNPQSAIFAVPLDQPASTAPKSWQFRHSPWTPPQPKTLADCPEGADVIAEDNAGSWYVVYRIATQAFCKGSSSYFSHADDAKFVQYLKPPQPAQLRLEDVPDGRVIEHLGSRVWKSEGRIYRGYSDGLILREAVEPTDFTVTDYIAEFREASC